MFDSLDQIDFGFDFFRQLASYGAKKNAGPCGTLKLDLLIVTTYVTHHPIK